MSKSEIAGTLIEEEMSTDPMAAILAVLQNVETELKQVRHGQQAFRNDLDTLRKEFYGFRDSLSAEYQTVQLEAAVCAPWLTAPRALSMAWWIWLHSRQTVPNRRQDKKAR
jgi:hypothetical protein